MKKTLKLVAVFMIIATLALSLVSCTMISGTYSSSLGDTSVVGSETTYKFSGFNFTRSTTAGLGGFEKTETVEGKYKIEEDQDDESKLVIIFTYENDKGEEVKETLSYAEGEENGVKYIKIGGIQYNKE